MYHASNGGKCDNSQVGEIKGEHKFWFVLVLESLSRITIAEKTPHIY